MSPKEKNEARKRQEALAEKSREIAAQRSKDLGTVVLGSLHIPFNTISKEKVAATVSNQKVVIDMYKLVFDKQETIHPTHAEAKSEQARLCREYVEKHSALHQGKRIRARVLAEIKRIEDTRESFADNIPDGLDSLLSRASAALALCYTNISADGHINDFNGLSSEADEETIQNAYEFVTQELNGE